MRSFLHSSGTVFEGFHDCDADLAQPGIELTLVLEGGTRQLHPFGSGHRHLNRFIQRLIGPRADGVGLGGP